MVSPKDSIARVVSMTGFARASGSLGNAAWVWEAKSVNARGLDLRIRVPGGLDVLDARAREALAARFTRGNVTLALDLRQTEAVRPLSVNRDMLEQVLALQASLAGRVDPAPPRLELLLGLRGMLDTGETPPDEAAIAARDAALLASMIEALDGLSAARAEEGARLAAVLRQHVDSIERLTAEAAAVAAAQPEQLADRLRRQVATLIEDATLVQQDRLATEIALLANKADASEELDRLRAHCAAARALIEAGGAIGRRLDFLAQEFNREANTLGSKANAIDVTRAALALKNAIEQFREQVQNVE